MATKTIVPLSQDARIAVVAAAAVKLGNDMRPGYMQRLSDAATEILLLAGDGGKIAKRLDLVANAGGFTGTVTGVAKEESSTRIVITLKTNSTKKPPEGLPQGYEQVRTDRTDSSDAALALGRRVRDNMIGHKVSVTLIHEPMDRGDMDVRIVVAVRDLGVSDDKEALDAIAAAAAKAA